MADFTITQGDARGMTRTLKDADGAVVNLTSASSVKFTMVDSDTVATIKINKVACVIVTAASGLVRYDFTTTDSNTPGVYLGEFEVIFADGQVHHFPTVKMTVEVLAKLA